jgi:nucleotide-binding universal stress UspA family protein
MEHSLPRRILVPICGGPTDEDAIRIGCRLARRQRAKVSVITILEVRRGLALGAIQQSEVDKAERWLTGAERIGSDLDVEVSTDLLQAREAGPAIIDEIRDLRADMVVLGTPWRQRFGEFHMGKTVPHVLRFAPCRVLLIREEAATKV